MDGGIANYSPNKNGLPFRTDIIHFYATNRRMVEVYSLLATVGKSYVFLYNIGAMPQYGSELVFNACVK